MEIRYYLGAVRAAIGDNREAREHFEAAQRFAATSAPARLQLARLAAREGHLREALSRIRALVADDADNILAGAHEVALLRLDKQVSRARERCSYWRQRDPTSNILRFEATRLGLPDAELWTHFAADSNRLLGIVDQYLALGDFEDARVLLEHPYNTVKPPAAEPGARSLAENPLIAYYRVFVAQHLGHARQTEAAAHLSEISRYHPLSDSS